MEYWRLHLIENEYFLLFYIDRSRGSKESIFIVLLIARKLFMKNNELYLL